MVSMRVIITCAGYASRLWPLTKDIPKPLLEVKGKPVLEHIIAKALELPEVEAVFIVTNHKFHGTFSEWLGQKRFPVPVKLINDGTTSNDDRLGQVGDINFVMESCNLSGDLAVLAGDNLFNFSLLPAYGVLRKTGQVVNPLWESKSYKDAMESGSVVLGDDGSFAEFMEKSPTPKSTLLSLGIYFFPAQKVHLIKLYLEEKNNPDKMGYFITWLMKREKVFGHVYLENWFDIGRIESLEQARKEFA